ncbi:GerW family sporulation protein [Shimazuella sp. AN120528]|uniref:GerW family sporulation protein n=1 Tax=Shimazuella soli TaxID=1892854 RepID=UPI001F0F19FA|nr:GerW family sporulation protein [Shimazuella soli]
MQTAMENLRDMVDVNTIIGAPVETPDGQVIIPVSKVGFGFAAGGSEFSAGVKPKSNGNGNGHEPGKQDGKHFPFGGGSGGGVSITPVAFIVVGDHGIRLLSMDGNAHLIDRIFDLAPNLFSKFGGKRKAGVCGTGESAPQTPID